MPTVLNDNGEPEYSYEMPERIREWFTPEYVRELTDLLKHICTDDMSQLIYFCGTYGWDKGIKQACRKTGSMKIYDYYSSLEWYDRDMFDGGVLDIIEAAGV